MVFFHELGHFLVARWCGVRVLVFSIGFGPELFGFNDRHGTRWKISAIPLGGYVKFFGDENAASVPDQAATGRHEPERARAKASSTSRSAREQPSWWPDRSPISCSRSSIFAGLAMIYGKPITSPRVDKIQPDSAAAAAGFQPGDVVVTINGRPIESFNEMQEIVSTSAGQTLTFEVDRGGARVTLKAVPALKEVKDRFGNVHRQGLLGIERSPAPEEKHYQPVGPLQAVGIGVQRTWFVIERTVSFIGGVFSGRESGRSARRADPDRPGLGAGGGRGSVAVIQPHRGAFDLDRAAQPVSGAAARRRSPSVLCDRSGAG